MTNTVNFDPKEILKLFFYIRDTNWEMNASLDILADMLLLYKSKNIPPVSPKTLSAGISRGDTAFLCVSPFKYGNEDRGIAYSALKIVAINSIILNICRACEAIVVQGYSKKLQAIAPNTNRDLQGFKKKYYTSEVIDYRNTYLAHPQSNTSKDFLDVDVIKSSLCDAVESIRSSNSSKISEYLDINANHFSDCISMLDAILKTFREECKITDEDFQRP